LPPPIFRFTVVLFSLFGLAIFFLGYAVPFTFSKKTTLIAAIGMSSVAAAAD
jgi:hypothetical protein